MTEGGEGPDLSEALWLAELRKLSHYPEPVQPERFQGSLIPGL